MVDRLSRPTQSRDRADSGLICCPLQLGPGSEELWGRRAIPAESLLGPSLHKIDQLFRSTGTRVLGAVGSTSYPGQPSPASELTQGQSSIPAHLVPGPS